MCVCYHLRTVDWCETSLDVDLVLKYWWGLKLLFHLSFQAICGFWTCSFRDHSYLEASGLELEVYH